MNAVTALEVVQLSAVMERTLGHPNIKVGLIDGPVLTSHPELAANHIQVIRKDRTCGQGGGMACRHGTFVAGVLSARPGTGAPAICPDCTLLVYPVFSEAAPAKLQVPSATPAELATGLLACIDAGAHIVNLSVSPVRASVCRDGVLEDALNQAARRSVLVVAAAGNGGTLGSTAITRHPWVIPVMACDLLGRPANETNLSHSMAKRGLRAPGSDIASLGMQNEVPIFSGTSVATPFVTGTLALLWSAHLSATAAQIKYATLQSASRGRSVVAPLLDAWSAYRMLAQPQGTPEPLARLRA